MSAAMLKIVRRWVGTEPDDQTLLDELAARPDPYRVAYQILCERYADLLNAPTGVNVAGDYSEYTTPMQLQLVEKRLRNLARRLGEDDPTAGTAPVISTVSRNHPTSMRPRLAEVYRLADYR